MKKVLATTALAAALALSLSGCTFGLGAPETKPAPKPQPSSETQPEPTDSADDAVVETTECVAGEAVTLDASDVELEFTGVCGDVTVTGDNVYADFEQVGNISISGDYATLSLTGSALDITVVGTGNSVFGNAAGSINVGGTYNYVSTTVATAIAVSGSDNSIAWMEGPANGTDTGTGNAFTGPAK